MNKLQRSNNQVFQFLQVTLLLLLVASGVFLVLEKHLTSVTAVRQFMVTAGVLGPLLFILIQITQVVVPLLPGGISLAAGVMIFGSAWGFVYNYVGICLGSLAAFLLVRQLGRSFLIKIAPKKLLNKYSSLLENQHKFTKYFALAIFFPLAPDDFLCKLAGLTDMKVKTFSLIILLGKPASIFLYSLGITSLVQLAMNCL